MHTHYVNDKAFVHSQVAQAGSGDATFNLQAGRFVSHLDLVR
ncbi:hypothetical protein [Helicobacter trogontum]|nr:hypothetical protein [Helicobacter trogontum]